jgi:hypothetical protein
MPHRRQTRLVYVVHGTKKLRDRVPPTDPPDPGPSTTAPGDWYATLLFWRPQVALFVNERTFLPVLMPFAPAAPKWPTTGSPGPTTAAWSASS